MFFYSFSIFEIIPLGKFIEDFFSYVKNLIQKIIKKVEGRG